MDLSRLLYGFLKDSESDVSLLSEERLLLDWPSFSDLGVGVLLHSRLAAQGQASGPTRTRSLEVALI